MEATSFPSPCGGKIANMTNIDSIVERIHGTVRRHSLGSGRYARWLWQDDDGSRDLGANPYGCADAANILYSIGRLPPGGSRERTEAVEAIQALQDPATGLFSEPTHHPIHTTAHCAAALELFDVRPLHPLRALEREFTVEGMRELLDSLDWTRHPWSESHKGAGIYAAGVLTESVTPEWRRAYFRKLWDDVDPRFGISRAGTLPAEPTGDDPLGGQSGTYSHLNAWFHYTFCLEHGRQSQRFPDRIIDTCLALYDGGMLRPADFGRTFNFAEVDWVYVLHRATRQTPYRFAEARGRIADFARGYLAWMEGVDFATHDAANDLHRLFGAVCCLAELQAALPGEIETTVPLRLVLDRRPFI